MGNRESKKHFKYLEHETGPHDWTWEQWEKIANLCDQIDYKCDFDDEGKCRHTRKNEVSKEFNKMCCCASCYSASGYLRAIPPKSHKRINKIFSEKTGFWRKGKGCVLPRSLRSSMCMSCNCHPIIHNNAPHGSRDDNKYWRWRAFIDLVGYGHVDPTEQITQKTFDRTFKMVVAGLKKHKFMKTASEATKK